MGNFCVVGLSKCGDDENEEDEVDVVDSHHGLSWSTSSSSSSLTHLAAFPRGRMGHKKAQHIYFWCFPSTTFNQFQNSLNIFVGAKRVNCVFHF
jgi:hypothetical protein